MPPRPEDAFVGQNPLAAGGEWGGDIMEFHRPATLGEVGLGLLVILLGIAIGSAFILTRLGQLQTALDPMPLEGIWEFELNYNRFQGEDGIRSGSGKAVIVWQRQAQQYEASFGASVSKTGDVQPVLSGFSRGYFAADETGWPAGEFSVDDVRYITRVHRDGVQPSAQVFRYPFCMLEKKGNRGDVIACQFSTEKTQASVRYKWSAPLH